MIDSGNTKKKAKLEMGYSSEPNDYGLHGMDSKTCHAHNMATTPVTCTIDQHTHCTGSWFRRQPHIETFNTEVSWRVRLEKVLTAASKANIPFHSYTFCIVFNKFYEII